MTKKSVGGVFVMNYRPSFLQDSERTVTRPDSGSEPVLSPVNPVNNVHVGSFSASQFTPDANRKVKLTGN